MAMKTYRALEKGYDGKAVIYAGELFTADLGEKAPKWAEEVTGPEQAEEAPARKPKGRQPVDETDG